MLTIEALLDDVVDAGADPVLDGLPLPLGEEPPVVEEPPGVVEFPPLPVVVRLYKLAMLLKRLTPPAPGAVLLGVGIGAYALGFKIPGPD